MDRWFLAFLSRLANLCSCSARFYRRLLADFAFSRDRGFIGGSVLERPHGREYSRRSCRFLFILLLFSEIAKRLHFLCL
jgi:hypothetical protein